MVKLRKMTVQVRWLSDQSWLVGSFGLISGPVPRVNSVNGFVKSYLSSTHVWCLQNFSDAEAKLKEEVKKFWDLDSVGIRGDEVSAYEKHASWTEFKKGR